MDSHASDDKNRRSFLNRLALWASGSILAVAGVRKAAAQDGPGAPESVGAAGKSNPTSPPPVEDPPGPLQTSGQILRKRVVQGAPPDEPLDTMIRFDRSDDNNNSRAMTHEILSLIHEEKGKNSYPWTIYAHLTTSHSKGDACVVCSRLTRKAGEGWSVGLHSETFNHAPGCCLGMNIETTNHREPHTDSTVIGLNVQAHGPQPCKYGVQIHDIDGGTYQTALALNNTKSQCGIDIGGDYDVGINARKNSIRLDEGACIELDGEGKIKIRYRGGKIEFLNGDKRVASINMRAEDHPL
jgi:hypothetical protein